jgi:hypothetical protein
MFETLATFHLLMSALNAVAPLNACNPSRALKGHAPHQPRRSVQRMVHAAPSGQECVQRYVLALDHRDAAQLRRLGGRRLERVSVLFTYDRVCG